MAQYYEIVDGGENNVYHFLFYMLSGFLVANVHEEIIYYYPNENNSKVSEGFLALLPANFKRHLQKDPTINYESFMEIIPNYEDFALPQSYGLMRYLFNEHMSKDIIPGKKIYIQRKPPAANSRLFVNESDIQNALEMLGYETICMEDYSIKEQIRIFSESEFIIAAHGAALAFTVFCNTGAKVLEIYGKHNNERKHYYHMAHVLKHGFLRFQDITETDESKENMLVNIPNLLEFLEFWHNNMLF
jgi:hypothetical protein